MASRWAGSASLHPELERETRLYIFARSFSSSNSAELAARVPQFADVSRFPQFVATWR